MCLHRCVEEPMKDGSTPPEEELYLMKPLLARRPYEISKSQIFYEVWYAGRTN